MKLKFLVSSMLMAGALMLSGSASATVTWQWTGTIGEWAADGSILDQGSPGNGALNVAGGDGDMQFNYGSLAGNLSSATGVTLTENEIGGKDVYNVGLDLPVNYSGGGSLAYSMKSLDGLINTAAFDTVVVISGPNQTYATKAVSSVTGSSLTTLQSINGSSQGPLAIGPFAVMDVVDTFNTSQAGATYTHSENDFTVAVSEPGTLVMLGFGLAAFGYSRRNTMVNSEVLAA